MTNKAAGQYDDLVRLFADASPLAMSHWNPRSGEVFSVPRGKARKAVAAAFEQRLMEEEDWLEVPYLESDDAHALAVAFAETLHPGKGKTAILAALAGDKPFRKLREVLAGAPGLTRRYRTVLEAEAEERLVTFCEGLGLHLDDPRFAAVLTRLQSADDDEEMFEEEEHDAAHRPAAALSIGRLRPAER